MTMSDVSTVICCFDLETTGIPTETDKHAVVEIGKCELTVLPTGETFVDAPRDILCNPGRSIPHDAMAIHHITDEMVADATGDLSFIGNADYFAAHYAQYEDQFVKVPGPLICTWKVALRIWPDAPQHGLQFLRYHLGLKSLGAIGEPHRAGPDAYFCARLLEKIIQQPNSPDLETMARWSAGLALLPRCPLFAHKGKKWADVPTSYLDWIVNKPNDVSRDVKANAKLELGKR